MAGCGVVLKVEEGTKIMSTKVTYKVAGKEVHPSQLADKMTEAALEAVKNRKANEKGSPLRTI